MLNTTQSAANQVDIELNGQLDSGAMRAALDELIEKSQDIANGHMLYRITEFSIPTLGAMGVEFRRLPKLFGLLGKFDKCAVLGDVSWLWHWRIGNSSDASYHQAVHRQQRVLVQ